MRQDFQTVGETCRNFCQAVVQISGPASAVSLCEMLPVQRRRCRDQRDIDVVCIHPLDEQVRTIELGETQLVAIDFETVPAN